MSWKRTLIALGLAIATFGLLNASTCAVTPDSQKSVGSSARVPGLQEGVTAKDRAIKTAVMTAISSDVVLKQFKIGVEVNKARVRLTGTVAREKMKREAAELAKAQKGVKGVLNKLEVDTSIEFLDPMDEYSDGPTINRENEDDGGWGQFEGMEGATN